LPIIWLADTHVAAFEKSTSALQVFRIWGDDGQSLLDGHFSALLAHTSCCPSLEIVFEVRAADNNSHAHLFSPLCFIVSVHLFPLQDDNDKTTQHHFVIYSDVEIPSIFIALARIVHATLTPVPFLNHNIQQTGILPAGFSDKKTILQACTSKRSPWTVFILHASHEPPFVELGVLKASNTLINTTVKYLSIRL
jgi:hypothetical protein